MNRVIIALVLFVLSGFSVNSLANMEPQALVENVAQETLTRIKKDQEKIKSDDKYLNVLVNELVIPHFDFQRMSKWVLGKYWRKAQNGQKERFVEEFKSLLIRTYASSLNEYVDQEIHYLPFRGDLGSGDVTVRSEIKQPGGFPIPINYRLHKKSKNWKVYDITIDDISLVANYRTSFSRQIRKSGIDALIKQLADKNK